MELIEIRETLVSAIDAVKELQEGHICSPSCYWVFSEVIAQLRTIVHLDIFNGVEEE